MANYTPAAFAEVRFAKKGNLAAHRYNGLWHMGSSVVSYDHEMAKRGWTPVQDQPELTIDTLRDEWEDAEIITADNLPREGDTIIRLVYGGEHLSVCRTDRNWPDADGVETYRILRRNSRPKGAERLEELLQEAFDQGLTMPGEVADWLTKSGVGVTDDDDD